MTDFVIPGLHALFIWWFSTGIVFWLNRRPRPLFGGFMTVATVAAALAFYEVWDSSKDETVLGAYQGFTSSVIIWIWIELSFYLGYVTGIRKTVCEEHCRGLRHFAHAIQACLWHEMLIIMCLVIIAAIVMGRPNQVALWTFVVFKWMHHSARINVFLGVRNIRVELLPVHLSFLKGFFRKRSMNALFPFSIAISVTIAVWIFSVATETSATAPQRTGLAFVGALMILAIVEHIVLMVPIPIEAIWAWWLSSGEVTRSAASNRLVRRDGRWQRIPAGHPYVVVCGIKSTDKMERRRP